MVTITPLKWEPKRRSSFADLTECSRDLDQAKQYFRYALELYPSVNPGISVQEIFAWNAFMEAGTVRYARPFASGRRFRLGQKEIDGFSDAEIELHSRLIAIRNRHIAHSVNLFEANWLALQVENHDSGHPKVSGVSTLGKATAPLSGRELKTTITMIDKLKAKIENVLSAERSKLLEEASQLSVDELAGLEFCDPKISENPHDMRS